MRLFIGIEFPEAILDKLGQTQDYLRRYVSSGRFTAKYNMHLTLQFLGEVPEDKVGDICRRLQQVAKGHSPLRLNLGALGCFGQNNPYRVVWLGLGGDLTALSRLQRAIVLGMKELGFIPENRPYKPHITLARDVCFTDGEAYRQALRLTAGGSGFAVTSFSLISSAVEEKKRVYRALATFEM
ncbi:RNA 2',3'-cyclic phosphodiesterase [Sporolituus thermophilus]|uniref:RNA 2',3'-cyclic phosphodiesterase n=1 Tax=Sporolituus thermophilus DSM 23256 TaxID=1123285 RepID=A0A1G7MZ34_9FIRM|nr:RNA 2',3'-cyclic phosphodiesterase [Sporolituus thermophilus]SDF67014.1 2'-5' RNA ligase [Sporolituus thermophilus DSM 23256]